MSIHPVNSCDRLLHRALAPVFMLVLCAPGMPRASSAWIEATPPAVAMQAARSEMYRGFITTYVSGDADSATAALEAWWIGNERDNADVLKPLPAALRPAAVALHLDTGLRALEDGRDDVGFRHLAVARWIADTPQILQQGATGGAEARRGAYLAQAWVRLMKLDLGEANKVLARSRAIFPADSDVLLISGMLAEASIGRSRDPRVDDGLSGDVESADDVLARAPVSKAQVDRGLRTRDAERYFRASLDARSTHIEARVRLARLLFIAGKAEDARRELTAAIAQIEALDSPSRLRERRVEYLAHLFLGTIEQASSDLAAADRQYTLAMTLCPSAGSARFARSQALLMAGRAGEARDLLQPLYRVNRVKDLPQIVQVDASDGVDACGTEPWGEYWAGARWRLLDLIAHLRGIVRS